MKETRIGKSGKTDEALPEMEEDSLERKGAAQRIENWCKLED